MDCTASSHGIPIVKHFQRQRSIEKINSVNYVHRFTTLIKYSSKLQIYFYNYIYIMRWLVAVSPTIFKMNSDPVELRTAALRFWRLSTQKIRHQR